MMADQWGEDVGAVCCWLVAIGRLSCKGMYYQYEQECFVLCTMIE